MLLAVPLRMRGIHVGLLLNFNVPTFYSVITVFSTLPPC